MTTETLSGLHFVTNPSLGHEQGSFFVEPVSTIPEPRDVKLSAVYDRPTAEIQAHGYRPTDPNAQRQLSGILLPDIPRNIAVYAYLNDKNLAGQPYKFPIGLAIGTDAKIGRRFNRTNVANLDWLFVRALGAKACLDRGLRNQGVAKALADGLLEQFDPELTVTVLNMPRGRSPEEVKKIEKTLQKYDFTKRTSRRGTGSGDYWYEGTTVQDLQNKLRRSSAMISHALPYPLIPAKPSVNNGLRVNGMGGGLRAR